MVGDSGNIAKQAVGKGEQRLCPARVASLSENVGKGEWKYGPHLEG